jgi:hypothetical protein
MLKPTLTLMYEYVFLFENISETNIYTGDCECFITLDARGIHIQKVSSI